MLYAYVGTLGESENLSYELSQPIPKLVYNNMQATLADEGLVPKALVQVGLIE